MAIWGRGNTKLMSLQAQQGLLFHRSNRLSRTNYCLEVDLMLPENHIIILTDEMLGIFTFFLKLNVIMVLQVLTKLHKPIKAHSKPFHISLCQNFTSIKVAPILRLCLPKGPMWLHKHNSHNNFMFIHCYGWGFDKFRHVNLPAWEKKVTVGRRLDLNRSLRCQSQKQPSGLIMRFLIGMTQSCFLSLSLFCGLKKKKFWNKSCCHFLFRTVEEGDSSKYEVFISRFI